MSKKFCSLKSQNYLEKLEKAYLLHRCSRYDLQGKEILKTQEKFYLAVNALRYTVHIGKTSDGEIDFVATRQNEKLYVQVTQKIGSEKTEKREYNRLLEIHDNYPKYVLSADELKNSQSSCL